MSEDERSLQHFLDENPEALGWKFSWGVSPTIVIPQFRLGSEYVADYVVIDAPQWICVYLIEIESAKDTPFNKDGTYSQRLNKAISQTGEWVQWIGNNRRYFNDKLRESCTEVVPRPEGRDFSPFARFASHTIRDGGYEICTAIVIGRREHFDGREELRQRFLHSQSDRGLFSFDSLVDACADRFVWDHDKSFRAREAVEEFLESRYTDYSIYTEGHRRIPDLTFFEFRVNGKISPDVAVVNTRTWDVQLKPNDDPTPDYGGGSSEGSS
jgi:hypothetical protein